jgi:SAM-dependent methyltransferase
MTAFGVAFASVYDATYADKDYDRECDVIVSAFDAHGGGVRTVIDLGCGTGNHSLRLAARGYDVTGVDLSPQMLERARAKADSAGADVCFICGDVRYVDAHGPYDAALMMFAVLGYQHTNADVRATFANVRRMLRPGGLLMFDAWHGPGVLADPPAQRTRIIETDRGAFERSAEADLDIRRHLCTVRYELRALDGRRGPAREEHVVRYFFPMELEMYLESCGFRTIMIGAAGDEEREPTAADWNMHVVAQAV